MIKKIVLTGGPCAGKTTVLSCIANDLTKLGYKVFVCSESATELINGGVRCFGEKALEKIDFQKLIMLYQWQKEEVYNDLFNYYKDDSVVIIYDRGLMDNKAYINEREFNDVLSWLSNKIGINVTEDDILQRYDMVIHLVTSAYGNNYTLENNSARTEDVKSAIELDRKTMEAWMNHSNLKVINAEEDFKVKVNNVLDSIHNLLSSSIRKRRQIKYQIDIVDKILESIKSRCIISDIEQIYLKNDTLEERIRKVKRGNDVSYYYTKQVKKENGESYVILNKSVTEEEYNILKNNCEIVDIITKRRYLFIYDKQAFRLDEYSNGYILELDVGKEETKVIIPEGIVIEKNICNCNKKRLTPSI